MKTYLITHKKTNNTMLFIYSSKGVLTEFKLNFKPILQFYQLLQPPFPFLIDGILLYKEHPSFRVQELKQDLSFKGFWDAFAYKHGNKQRAERLWKLLTEVQKAKAIAYIPTYKAMLVNSNKDHLYPETYLNQKRFDNE